MELGRARQTFLSNISVNTPPSQIPSEIFSDSKCSEFASFFKINNITMVISTSMSCAGVRQIRPQPEKVVTMSDQKEIDGKILEETVQHLKTSTFALDTLPTSLFKSVLHSLEADLLEVVNASLLSCKTAVVKSLLKKSNLDKTIY